MKACRKSFEKKRSLFHSAQLDQHTMHERSMHASKNKHAFYLVLSLSMDEPLACFSFPVATAVALCARLDKPSTPPFTPETKFCADACVEATDDSTPSTFFWACDAVVFKSRPWGD